MWAAEVKHAVLLIYSSKRRVVVPEIFFKEVESLRRNIVNGSGVAEGSHGTEVLKGFMSVGSLRRQSLSSLTPTKRIPFLGGLNRFMNTVVVGRVVRMAEKCLRRLRSTWNIPSLEIRSERQTSLPCFRQDYTFWWVIGLFQIGSTVNLV